MSNSSSEAMPAEQTQAPANDASNASSGRSSSPNDKFPSESPVSEHTPIPQKRSASPAASPAKKANDEPDFTNSLSRKEIQKTVHTKQPLSVYNDAAQEVPAWMKSKIQATAAHKYDKYGSRPSAASARVADSDSRYARYGAKDDRYARYGAAPAAATDSRVIRRDPEPEKKKEPPVEEPVDDAAEVAAYTSVPTMSGPGMSSDYKTFHSNISHKENKDINSIVRQHYNQRTYQSKLQGSRTKSPIYKMRNFNNAIKYILLGNWVKRRAPQAPLVFLDLCCGKGGDLNKCEFVNVDQYVGIDISDASVREAYSRYSQNKARFIPQNPQSKRNRDARRYNFEACFATGDLFTYSVPEVLEKNFPGIIDGLFPVDTVSIQFSFHYAWETEAKVHTILNNITRSLRPGGTFIGTIPSSDFIKNKIINKEYTAERTFGNDLYHVKFELDPPEDGVFRSPFGNRYDYFLKDAVDDVPEYVVPFETLRSLCEDYGLILKYKKNFSEIFGQEIPKYFNKLNKNLIEGMKRADGKYGVEGDEKEAVAFYIGFVFEKVGN